MFGGKDISNTLAITTGEHTKVFNINTDNNMMFFVVFSVSNPGNDCYVLGKSSNGRFVKYLDTEDITKRFFGTSTVESSFSMYYQECACRGDTIIIPYRINYLVKTYPTSKYDIRQGEFRFKWDDKAQWFGIEQVVY